jgi:signal transduction histidine kinase
VRAHVLSADGERPRRVRIELNDPELHVRAADHDSFFEAFRPSYAPSGRRVTGLGLGPALARALVRAHGGEVWFASRADKGTTFSAEFPIEA